MIQHNPCRMIRMGKTAIIIGTAGHAVSVNVALRRSDLSMTQQVLSDLTRKFGRPLTRQAVAEIETRRRRVDVDDLVVLSKALGLSAETLMDPAALTTSPEAQAEAAVDETETALQIDPISEQEQV